MVKGTLLTNKTANTSTISSNEWFVYFKSLLFKNNDTSIPVEDSPIYYNEQMVFLLNSEISPEEVQRGLLKLKTRKAHGKDGISAEFFKKILSKKLVQS